MNAGTVIIFSYGIVSRSQRTVLVTRKPARPRVVRAPALLAQCALVFAALILAQPLMRPLTAQSDEGIVVGASAPAVVVSDVAGKLVRVAPRAGQPMLIEFWATWCEFCERLEPTMKAVHAKYGKQVQFAAIAVNVNQSPARVAKHVKQRSLLYPVYYDASGKATQAYEVAATSFVVIIDKNGKVAYTGVGDKQDLDAAIRRVL